MLSRGRGAGPAFTGSVRTEHGRRVTATLLDERTIQ